jgi:hypothetical protein
MKKYLGILFLSASLYLVSGPAFACADSDMDCVKAAWRDHVVNRIGYWKAALDKPFAQRFSAAPAELIDYLRLDNMVNGLAERPTAAVIPPDFQNDLDAAIAEMPAAVKRALNGRLAGVYLVHGLGGSGFTESIRDDQGEPVAAYVVLDLDVLAQRTANQWATWKESSPFRASDKLSLQATLETPDNDNRKNALQYILLHEFGHVLSVGQHFHPPWSADFTQVDAAQYPFFSLSWRYSAEQKKYVTNFEGIFPLRRQVVYYFGAKLDANDMLATYKQLEATNFPTLYAATNPFDDFAESFVNYVHSVMLGKPFEIRILSNDRIVKSYHSCWDEARCAEKRNLLEQAIGSY